jgi:hypothetical protein
MNFRSYFPLYACIFPFFKKKKQRIPLLSGLISLLRLEDYEILIFEIVTIDKQNEVAKFYRGQIRQDDIAS